MENVSPYCEVSKASLKDNIEELKNIIFTKNIHKKELKTGFLYEEKGLRKLNDIQCKSRYIINKLVMKSYEKKLK